MTDVAIQSRAFEKISQHARSQALARFRFNDGLFFQLTRASAIIVLVLLAGIILSLIFGAALALGTFGFNFLISERWNPVTEVFGAAAPIYGTVVTSIIALLIAAPVGLLIALFLTELCPMWLRRP
ncbi:MAG: phosphate ABC transporter permease PstC, partial [Xanthobacteraceae bacterium]|nr:phosphate ABC transporter permease PstC [Xanthobacteraceae bacterium]